MALTIDIFSGGAWTAVTNYCPYLGDPEVGLPPLSLEQEAENHIAVVRFGLYSAGAAIADTQEEVRVVDTGVPGVTLFSGFIANIRRWRVGTEDVCEVEVQDRNIQLEWTVVPGYTIDQGDADDTEIAALFAAYLNTIGTGVYVDQLDAAMEELYLEGTMRECLENICNRTGGRFYVDYTDNLHYFAGADYPAANGWNLSDAPDFAGTYPYKNFVVTEDATRVFDRVYVVGEGVADWHGAGNYETIVYDNTITTAQGITDRGTAIIAAFGTMLSKYECDIWKDDLVVGIEIDVTHSDFLPAPTTLVVRRITMRCRSVDGDEREYHLELGETGRTDDWWGGGPGGGSGGPGEAPPIFGDGTNIDTIECDDALDAGSERFAAREDHQHAIVCAAPIGTLTEATANAEGVAYSFARSDHTHDIDVSGSYGPNDASYLVLGLDAGLSAERVFTPADGIGITDGGANGTYQVYVDLDGAWSGLEFDAGQLRIDEDEAFTWTGDHIFTSANGIEIDVASGDPIITFDTAGADRFTLGVDDSDSDKFKINSGSALGNPSDFEIDSSGNVEMAGSLYLGGEYIYHLGDLDTYARFTTPDQIRLVCGGVTMLNLIEGATDYAAWGVPVRMNGHALYIDTDDDTYIHDGADDHITLNIAGNDQYTFDATDLQLADTGGTTRLSLRAHGDTSNVSADIYANARLGMAADEDVGVFIDADNNSSSQYFAVMKNAQTFAGATEVFRVTEAPKVLINDTVNSNQTIGFTINQGGNDDHLFDVKSSDVGHLFTAYAELDTYGYMRKSENGSGGLQIVGLKDSADAAGWALTLDGMLGQTANTTKTTAGLGVVTIRAMVTDGGTGAQACAADANLVTIRNYTTTRFIFDAEGSGHADVEFTTFDEHDDVGLLSSLEKSMLAWQKDDPVKSKFASVLKENRAQLEELGLVHFDDDNPGHAMLNTTKLLMLLTGAVQQLSDRVASTERRLLEAN